MSVPFISHSEITDTIYIVCGTNKYNVTEQVIKAMRETGRLEQQRPHGEWIPICVSVPEKDGRYIVSLPDRGGTIMCADYLGGEWYPDDYECTSNHVIAWRPLPEPYKKEGDEK